MGCTSMFPLVQLPKKFKAFDSDFSILASELFPLVQLPKKFKAVVLSDVHEPRQEGFH